MISSDHITALTQGTDYNVSDRVVTLTSPTTLKIQIYRETTTKPLVGWADASVLRAADMTVQSTQLLHLSEETMDKVQDSGLAQDTNDGVWDARYNRIKNLLDPQEPGDAVTLAYIVANQTSLLTALKATGKEQNESIVSTGNTQNTRLTTTGNTQNKRLTDTGDSYVSTMTTLKDTATTKATEASDSAELSKKWAMSSTSPDGVAGNKSSKTWAEEAKSSASASATSAKNSASSASASSASASAAKTSETNAKNSATASASSASASSASASAAKTSETNAATSATASANSASAAAKSAENAKTWDPTAYKQIIELQMTPWEHSNVYILQCLGSTLTPSNGCGGTFTFYESINNGWAGYGLESPAHITIHSPYSLTADYALHSLQSTSSYVYPRFLKNTKSGDYYVGLVYKGNSKTAFLFGDSYNLLTSELQALSLKDDVLPENWEFVKEIPCRFIKQPTTDEWNSKADLSALSSEAAKWRKAYNDLRKRSYPTEFDDAELVALSSNVTELTESGILSQPYTNFDGLYCLVSGDDYSARYFSYISVSELNMLIKSARAKVGDMATVELIHGPLYHSIYVSEAKGFTSSRFPRQSGNCWIEQIYGVKFKEVT